LAISVIAVRILVVVPNYAQGNANFDRGLTISLHRLELYGDIHKMTAQFN